MVGATWSIRWNDWVETAKGRATLSIGWAGASFTSIRAGSISTVRRIGSGVADTISMSPRTIGAGDMEIIGSAIFNESCSQSTASCCTYVCFPGLAETSSKLIVTNTKHTCTITIINRNFFRNFNWRSVGDWVLIKEKFENIINL